MLDNINLKSFRTLIEFFGYTATPDCSLATHYTRGEGHLFVYLMADGNLSCFCPLSLKSYAKIDLFFYLVDIFKTSDLDTILTSMIDDNELTPKKTSTPDALLSFYFSVTTLVLPQFLYPYSMEHFNVELYNYHFFTCDTYTACPLFDKSGEVKDFMLFSANDLTLKSNTSNCYWNSPITEELTSSVFFCNPYSLIHYVNVMTPHTQFLYLSTYNLSTLHINSILALAKQYGGGSLKICTSFYHNEYNYICSILTYMVNQFSECKLSFTLFSDEAEFTFLRSGDLTSIKTNQFFTQFLASLREGFVWNSHYFSPYFKYFRSSQGKLPGNPKTDVFSVPLKPYVFKFFIESFSYFIFSKNVVKLIYTQDIPMVDINNNIFS